MALSELSTVRYPKTFPQPYPLSIYNSSSYLGKLSFAYPVDCNKVIWYFQAHGYGPNRFLHGGKLNTQRVKGFYFIFVNEEKMIDHVYYELNSLAQGIDAHLVKYVREASVGGGSGNR